VLRRRSRPGVPAQLTAYNPADLHYGVVHFGIGGFHRAHQGVYCDELAGKGLAMDWGAIGVGLHRREMTDVLERQDNLCTVIEPGAEEGSEHVTGSMADHLYAPEGPEAVLATLVSEHLRATLEPDTEISRRSPRTPSGRGRRCGTSPRGPCVGREP
jgi:mannitol 2-dehydrogenase